MIQKVYTVYDSKAEAYLNPFHMNTNGEALRAWKAAVKDPQTNFNKFPSDFTLFEIGTYDSNTGSYEMFPAKVSLGTALEWMSAE